MCKLQDRSSLLVMVENDLIRDQLLQSQVNTSVSKKGDRGTMAHPP